MASSVLWWIQPGWPSSMESFVFPRGGKFFLLGLMPLNFRLHPKWQMMLRQGVLNVIQSWTHLATLRITESLCLQPNLDWECFPSLCSSLPTPASHEKAKWQKQMGGGVPYLPSHKQSSKNRATREVGTGPRWNLFHPSKGVRALSYPWLIPKQGA